MAISPHLATKSEGKSGSLRIGAALGAESACGTGDIPPHAGLSFTQAGLDALEDHGGLDAVAATKTHAAAGGG